MEENYLVTDVNYTFSTDTSNESDYIDSKLMERYLTNKGIDEPAYSTLIVMYCFLMIMGALGNTLVIVTVVRKPAMRTPRNMFIVNLAVADLLLCAITMPLTLMEILTKYFPLGNNLFVCKIIGILQATSTYVSTISITAIALDRYQVIVYPTKESLQQFGATLILLLIWVVALLLAMPLFIVRHLVHHSIPMGNDCLNINFCIENWPVEHGRAYYSIFSLIFQYTLPIIIVSVAYVRISYKLRHRFASGFTSEEHSHGNRRELRGRRLHKTNLLLGSIAFIFCISWLPLNVFNLVADLSVNQSFTSQPMMIVYAVCHMMGMSSACSNPILYGCLNENFWKEFKDILCIESSVETMGQSKRVSFKKNSQNSQSKAKPDLVTGAIDYQLCNTPKLHVKPENA
ncbi:neuropeptide F receptor isoform X2 [Diorhabda sublineata]|uniref:neuropeptide F receptor isoform X2 n=1 Tax=Diorhabda sublineata TaxID=1163346 RepID=UPI0024E18E25|nr:neuropeptide F receptor isoform X2 [Diorhabda sublineata]